MPRAARRSFLHGARAGKLRIIGGSLRGSKLAVDDVAGLRPTPDRVRETLFNWLAPVIDGARCLDLFAGTGALGIEALSRGAAWVDFVERDPRLVQALRQNLQRLRQTDAAIRCADALQALNEAPTDAYDVVFVDPPFSDTLWQPAAFALESHGWLRPSAWVYLEMPVQAQVAVPDTWNLHRESHAGAVRYALYRRLGASAKL
jgi:16S rRNA (guanine966-N2)-methyltransferase